jgi:long-subunit acyl-CoA synthetase (AMP-forming)
MSSSSAPELLGAATIGTTQSRPGRTWRRITATQTTCFTSGTPGVPKGVLHTHRSLATETCSFLLFPKRGGEQGLVFRMLPGGAGVPPEMILRGERLGITISRCFGLTEHPTITSCLPADPIHKRA